MNKNTTITIDLAKDVFQIAVFNQAGKCKLNKAVSRNKLQEIIALYPHAKIYMEACGSAHYWARYYQEKGHFVGLIPAQIVASYRHGNKSDKNDTLAIYESSKNQSLHFVAVKTLEQQDISTLHSVREGFKKQRNQTSNRIRGLAFEYGVLFSQSIPKLKKQIPDALEDASNDLTAMARQLIRSLYVELNHLEKQYTDMTKMIEKSAKSNEHLKRLMSIPGIGPLIASILYAKLGKGDGFKKGRNASALLGLVPSHWGTGGKVRIGGISKRGDTYARALTVNGARSVVINIKDKQDPLSCWIRALLERSSFNKVVVAVANKIVRMALAVLKSGDKYKPAV